MQTMNNELKLNCVMNLFISSPLGKSLTTSNGIANNNRLLIQPWLMCVFCF